jgi:hypothetical protein
MPHCVAEGVRRIHRTRIATAATLVGMTNTNTEVPPPTSAPAPVQERPRRRWVTPLVGGLAVVAALAVGGVGGYALANATDAGGPPGIHAGPQGGQQAGPPDARRGPGPDERPERSERPHEGDNDGRPGDPGGDTPEG